MIYLQAAKAILLQAKFTNGKNPRNHAELGQVILEIVKLSAVQTTHVILNIELWA